MSIECQFIVDEPEVAFTVKMEQIPTTGSQLQFKDKLYVVDGQCWVLKYEGFSDANKISHVKIFLTPLEGA